jgi:hypothetical protein
MCDEKKIKYITAMEKIKLIKIYALTILGMAVIAFFVVIFFLLTKQYTISAITALFDALLFRIGYRKVLDYLFTAAKKSQTGSNNERDGTDRTHSD